MNSGSGATAGVAHPQNIQRVTVSCCSAEDQHGFRVCAKRRAINASKQLGQDSEEAQGAKVKELQETLVDWKLALAQKNAKIADLMRQVEKFQRSERRARPVIIYRREEDGKFVGLHPGERRGPKRSESQIAGRLYKYLSFRSVTLPSFTKPPKEVVSSAAESRPEGPIRRSCFRRPELPLPAALD